MTGKYLIPTSVFWTGKTDQSSSSPRVVAWREWSLRSVYPDVHAYDNGRLAITGLRVVDEDQILDFNQYDLARNIYQTSSAAVSIGRDDTTNLTDSASNPDDFRRLIPLSLADVGEGGSESLFWIEDHDGPKVRSYFLVESA